MPRKSSGKSAASKKVKQETVKKTCCTCNELKNVRWFYRSYNPLHSDGYFPMCKDCIKNACYDESNNDVDMDKLKNLLRQLDRPFLMKYYHSAVNEYNRLYEGKKVPKRHRLEIIGYYFKYIQTLPQVRTLSWEEGLSLNIDEIEENLSINEVTNSEKAGLFEKFVVTDEIKSLFGEGYTEREYKIMWNRYEAIKDDYPNVTNSQKMLLLRYIRFSAKEEIACQLNNTSDAEKWSKQATEALKQLNQSDLQGGVNCFSEFFRKVERTKDILRILPEYKFRPNDALDFVIWCYINYCRRLEGKPECDYSDIYKFYDDKVNEYVEQYGDPYGIFENDPTIQNREKINKFIKLPSDNGGNHNE